jgi:hypothetical protein
VTPYIYVASSWRNAHYPRVVKMLRAVGAGNPDLDEPDFGVHDFRDPAGHFQWEQIDPAWETWDTPAYIRSLAHPAADVGYGRDKGGLDRATACLLVGPCGRSAHLELGYAIGRGIPTAICLPQRQEPELMYRMAGSILASAVEVMAWAGTVLNPSRVTA